MPKPCCSLTAVLWLTHMTSFLPGLKRGPIYPQKSALWRQGSFPYPKEGWGSVNTGVLALLEGPDSELGIRAPDRGSKCWSPLFPC